MFRYIEAQKKAKFIEVFCDIPRSREERCLNLTLSGDTYKLF